MADFHPIFGRADEDDDRALLLEGQLKRFCDAIRNEWDRLDDFLPPAKAGDQAAEDWRSDLAAATDLVRGAARDLRTKLEQAERFRKRHPKPASPDRVVVLEDLLDRAAEFLDGYVDVVDGDYGVPEPNKAMRLVSEIREVVPTTNT